MSSVSESATVLLIGASRGLGYGIAAEYLERGSFDLLFVNAGVTNRSEETTADVSTDEFTRLMVTNASITSARPWPDEKQSAEPWPAQAKCGRLR